MSGLKRKLSVSVPTLTFKVRLPLRYRLLPDFGLQDEDGAEISLQDESDWESAVDVAKDFSNGRGIGKVGLAPVPVLQSAEYDWTARSHCSSLMDFQPVSSL